MYSTVYAVDAAGLQSARVSSDGVVIDSTPPVPVHKFRFGPNLLKNPSFEAGRSLSIPDKWTGNGIFFLTNTTSAVEAQDGHVYLDIASGYVEQTISTVKTKKYRVTFYIRSPDNGRFHSQQLGYTRLPGFHAAYIVAITSVEWQKHVYYFISSDTTSVVRIGAVGRKTGFLLDNVRVEEVGDGRLRLSTDPKDPVNSHVQPMHVHMNSRGRYTALTAAWDVEDPESPVTNYYWAIGTVLGAYHITLTDMKTYLDILKKRQLILHALHNYNVHHCLRTVS